MAIIENADYTLTGEQVIDLRDRVKSALQLPGTVIGNGAPTTSTEGNVGQFYYDTTNDKLYYCKAKTAQGTDPETYVYTWEENPDTTYSAGANISISEQNVISATGLPTVLTDPEYEELWNGPTPVPSEWGVLSYYSRWTTEYDANGMGCEVNSINAAVLDAFLEEHPSEDPGMIEFMYEDGVWLYGWEDPVEIQPEDMVATTGIDVTVYEGESFANLMIELQTVVDPTSEMVTVELTENEYLGLSTDSSIDNPNEPYTIGGEPIPRLALYSFEFGSEPTAVSDNFLTYCVTLTTVDTSPATELVSIGSNFLLGNRSLNSAIIIPAGVTSIGNYFLSSCAALTHVPIFAEGSALTSIPNNFLRNSPLTDSPVLPDTVTTLGSGYMASTRITGLPHLPSSLTTIGAEFLRGCAYLVEPFSLPSTLTNINGDRFLFSCRNMTAPINVGSLPASVISYSGEAFACDFNWGVQYTTGMTLAGTTAADWKTKFPDSDTHPYRKILLAS